jgi:hypothetical protein
MKKIALLSLGIVGPLLSSCEQGGFTPSSDFDPLMPPGSVRPGQATSPVGLKAGSYAVTAIGNAAFFKERPNGSSDANKMLPENTEVKVVSDDGTYTKVELNSGEVGYIPSVLLTASTPGAPKPAAGSYQVYPPAPGTTPVPDTSTPVVPTMIDPDAATSTPANVPALQPNAPDFIPDKPASETEKKAGE